MMQVSVAPCDHLAKPTAPSPIDLDMTDTGANHTSFDTSFTRFFMVELICNFNANPLTWVLEPWNTLNALVRQTLKEEEEEEAFIQNRTRAGARFLTR
jgi:hypothetical protein